MTAASGSGHEIGLPGLDDELRRLDELARGVAAAWSSRTLAATTMGRERALLRLFGVSGLDRSGLPLAGSVVDRFVGSSRERLADGVSLPFAMALVEYDVSPLRLAVDIADGLIDLEREAELLVDPDHRARAEAAVSGLVAGAIARIDANRTARRELCAVLGDPAGPWVATAIQEHAAGGAAAEVRDLAQAGFDVLRIEVPMGRELSGLLEAAGEEVAPWRPGGAGRGDADPLGGSSADDEAPAGSQRGLAAIRRAADEAAATRRGYVRLASAAPPLAAPEQAVVAAFERVDLVVADAMAEIVSSGVDPDRALADHAFGAALHRRAGTMVLIGPGPLVVGPDLSRGRPSDVATRSGRALALQLLGVHLARGSGLPAEQLVVGAVPASLAAERLGAALSLAEVALRRRLLPEHGLWFTTGDADEGSTGPSLSQIGGLLPADAAAMLQVSATHRPGSDPGEAAGAARTVLATGTMLARSRTGVQLDGPALDHARATAAAAVQALDGLAGAGWRSILGEDFDDAERRRFGADAVTERTESNHPLRQLLG